MEQQEEEGEQLPACPVPGGHFKGLRGKNQLACLIDQWHTCCSMQALATLLRSGMWSSAALSRWACPYAALVPSSSSRGMSSRRRPDRAAASSSASSSSSEQAAAAAPLPPPPDPYQLLLEGKRFVCTECGKCCTGSGEVWANERECAAIAAHLGVTLAQFLARYTKAYSRRPGWRMLKLAQPSGDCIFLREGRHCSIYGARPLQCSSYPWWPELMDPGVAAQQAARCCSCQFLLGCLRHPPGGCTSCTLPGPPNTAPACTPCRPPSCLHPLQRRGWPRGARCARALSTRARCLWTRQRRPPPCGQPPHTLQTSWWQRRRCGGGRRVRGGGGEGRTAASAEWCTPFCSSWLLPLSAL